LPDLTGKSTRPSARGFEQVSRVITEDNDISDGAFRTYVMLLGFARLGQTWVGRAQLAQRRGVTEKTISAHMVELVAAGYITRQERKELTAITTIVPIDKVAQKGASRQAQKCASEVYSKGEDNESFLPQREVGPGISSGVPAVPESQDVPASGKRSGAWDEPDSTDRGQDDSGIADSGNLRGGHKAPRRIIEPDDPVGDFEGAGMPNWMRPGSPEEEAFLAAVGAKVFKPRQKAVVKGIAARIRAGAILNGGVYAECARQLESITDMGVTLPAVLPLSWWKRNLELAKQYRWSREKLLAAMLNRDRLMVHIRFVQGSAATLTEQPPRATMKVDDYLDSLKEAE
jgi:hypothetical protein